MSSIQERLQAAREVSERKHPVSLPLPGFANDELVVRYKSPNWDISKDYVRAMLMDAPTAVELEAIADGLVAASVGSEAHIDGDVHELPHKLGVRLAEYLGVDVTVPEGAGERRMTDREAVFALIPDDVEMVGHWNQLVAESRAKRKSVEDDVAGESQAG